MKKILLCLIICIIILSSFNKAAFANPSPKPSLIFDFKGLEGEKFYLTVLSETDTKYEEYKESDEDFFVFQKFLSYTDKDGFNFTNRFVVNTENYYFSITGYDLPQRFKILLYFPEYNSFAISDKAYGRYAYNSYYIVNLHGINIKSSEQVSVFKVETNYDSSFESISFVLRVIATIGIEIIFALIFGFSQKKQLLLIVLTNIVTQTILNVLLNTIHYQGGLIGFINFYIWLETLVFIIEAIVYAVFLSKVSKPPVSKGRAVFYAWTANTVSYFVGVIIGILFSTTIL